MKKLIYKYFLLILITCSLVENQKTTIYILNDVPYHNLMIELKPDSRLHYYTGVHYG
jgi:hypothetical protein